MSVNHVSLLALCSELMTFHLTRPARGWGLDMNTFTRSLTVCTTLVLTLFAAFPRTDVVAQDATDSTPSAQDETTLYEADWSTGLADWTVDAGWDVFDNMLIADGSAVGGAIARPPYSPGDRFNSAVEAEFSS